MEEICNDNIIKIEGLVFEYVTDEGNVRALDGVSLEIERGAFTSVIGRNGSGKSTLAKNINALLTPSEGCVIVGGYDTQSAEYLWEIRRMAGMVFQNPDNQLVSAVVEDDVAFGPENLGLPREEIIERVRISLDAVDMTEHRKMAPHLLSGGQKQRVAIAGALAMKPEIIIFDEPTAMLDPEGRKEVLEIASRLHAEGITVLLITHFMEETVPGDRIIIMDRGRVCIDGTPRDVFARAAEIEGIGLKLPFAVELANCLRARGAPLPAAPILTEDELAAEILKYFGETVSGGSGRGARAGAAVSPRDSEPAGAEAIITLEHLSHTYNKGLAYETSAVKDVSFEIFKGEYIAIIGHTGSGKSTLIQHLNGLLKPTEGAIIVGGVDVSAKGASVVSMRRKIGMVFQYPEYQLFEETVYLDIAFGPKNLGVSADEVDERVKESMALINMDFNEFAQRSPMDLSGGQKRMAAIAGVLAMRPEVLVLDEPTAGLDPKSHDEILALIELIHKKTGCTVIIVSHNMDDVAMFADRVFVMAAGEVVKEGSPVQVYDDEAFMKSIGLGVPRAASFAERLRREGLDLPDGILYVNDLAEVLAP